MKQNIISNLISILLFFSSIFSGCSHNFTDNDFNLPESEPVYTLVENTYTYNIPKRYYSDGIKNIVKRSRQIKEISWNPVVDLEAFNGDYYFKKGIEVFGIPYSQPVFNGKFLIYQTTLDEFLSESKKENSPFYTEKGTYEEPSTYYGMDCSAFVSYAWNCKNRLTAKNLSQFGDYNGNSLNSVQVGDALIRTANGVHAVLVTGVKEDENNNVIWVEITEQTPPLTKQTRYGDGELFSIDDFLSIYLNDGFKIYRNTDFRDKTPFVHSCSSPVGEYCEKCFSLNEHKNLNHIDTLGDIMLFEAEFSPLNPDTKVYFTYSLSHIHLGYERYVTDKEHYIRMRSTIGGTDSLLLIPPETKVTIFEKSFDANGELWGRARIDNKVGWMYLESSTYMDGAIIPGEEKAIPEESCSKIEFEKYASTFKCILNIPQSSFFPQKKLQIFAYDSEGNKYLVGEYIGEYQENT